MRYRVVDKNGQILFCNLHPKEVEQSKDLVGPSQKIEGSKIRAGMMSNQHGSAYAFSSHRDYVASSQKFRTTLETILHSIENVVAIINHANAATNKNTSRLIHNLTTLNAHNIQEIYSLIPQESVSKKTGGQVALVEKIVRSEPRETALALLRIAKNNTAMKVEFSVFKKLFDNNPNLQKQKHNVHKVLMNIFYLFFPDFTDKDVRVVVEDSKDLFTAYFDYESLHVALYHLLENAAKYIKPDSIFDVSIKNIDDRCEITMDMLSLEIKAEEVDLIFDEGKSGDMAKLTGKSGDGIGMNRAKKILALNSGDIVLLTHPDTVQHIGNAAYQRNIFTITLPIKI